MKTFRFSKIAIFIGVFSLVLFSSCSNDDDNGTTTPQQQDIVGLAQSTNDLSTLVAALQQANLVSALQADGPFTVFAPTNQAFQNLLDSNDDWDSLSDIPNDLLTNVLLFHVVSGEVKSTDLSDTYVKTLATGPNDENLSLQIQTTGGIKFNGDASPTSTIDVMATNGVVHVIDKVMLPPNIVKLAQNNDEFSSLVAALTDSRHTTNFVSTLSGDGPFTVFAPNNTAFQELLDSNDEWNGIADIPIETLAAVLSYHVVNGANVQSDQLTDDQVIDMFGSGSVTVDLSGPALETGSGQTVEIIGTDVQGANGVIHVVKSVLIPGD